MLDAHHAELDPVQRELETAKEDLKVAKETVETQKTTIKGLKTDLDEFKDVDVSGMKENHKTGNRLTEQGNRTCAADC